MQSFLMESTTNISHAFYYPCIQKMCNFFFIYYNYHRASFINFKLVNTVSHWYFSGLKLGYFLAFGDSTTESGFEFSRHYCEENKFPNGFKHRFLPQLDLGLSGGFRRQSLPPGLPSGSLERSLACSSRKSIEVEKLVPVTAFVLSFMNYFDMLGSWGLSIIWGFSSFTFCLTLCSVLIWTNREFLSTDRNARNTLCNFCENFVKFMHLLYRSNHARIL